MENKIIWVQYIPTAEMMANSLTKALRCEKHEMCTAHMGMVRRLDVNGSFFIYFAWRVSLFT